MYTDLYGLRKLLRVNLSGWDGGKFSAVTDGNVNHRFSVAFAAQDRPVRITDGAGHATAVLWESNSLFDDQPVPVTGNAWAGGLPYCHDNFGDNLVKLSVSVPNVYAFALSDMHSFYIVSTDGAAGDWYSRYGSSDGSGSGYGGGWGALRWENHDVSTGLYYTRQSYSQWPVNAWLVPVFDTVREGLDALRAYLDAQ